MSRSDAKHKFKMEQFKKEMLNVYSSSICRETLDEAPMAYKDVEKIKEYVENNITII